MKTKKYIAIIVLVLCNLSMSAQEFFNLTAEEVKIDSMLPVFVYEKPLGRHYADSTYQVKIEYPEFIDMSAADAERYQAITAAPLPQLPEISQYIGISRKQGTLYVHFTPLVCRDGKLQKLVSFKLNIKGEPIAKARTSAAADVPDSHADRYAEHSVLATGSWAKIRVPSTGIYQLTDALVRKAGFSNPAKVKIFGYGGAMQPEKLTGDYLIATDDLKEVPTCTVNGKRLFHATGSVGWSSDTAKERTRNPYSDYGYYFLTQQDDEPLTVDSAAFTASFYPTTNDYHTLYETDNYAWYHGGRNLYESTLLSKGERQFTLASTSKKGTLTVSMSYDGDCDAEVKVNGESVGNITVNQTEINARRAKAIDTYSKAAVYLWNFSLDNLNVGDNTISLRQISGANMRLDYLSLCFDTPMPLPNLATATFEAPEFVYNITNQDHHADTAVDMVIIIPTSQNLRTQAERLKAFHEEHDSLRVRIVPADELYNEFASGTPDANAYRRYLKMMYDRAENDSDIPRFLLLFGDGTWDNRMLTSDWKSTSPDNFLLCYESDNSFSETDCYVSDDYYCLMDDGEGDNMVTSDKSDIAVGRLTPHNDSEATILVDKAIGYMKNENAGAWQNTLCFMGDDGNYNMHMDDADKVVAMVQQKYPAYNIKKIYWDAYTRVSSSTGLTYPDVTRLIKQQMQTGALIMNYTGHGAAYTMSHEMVVKLADFAEPTSLRLPLWLTASCDIMPFDGAEENIGETAMLNKQGGAIAFYGTTRTVYSNYNRYMNLAFTEYVFGTDDNGRRYTIGEAARLAKNRLLTPQTSGNGGGNDYTTNKLQYTLLGDPALTLAAPTKEIVIDEINGQAADGTQQIKIGAGTTATVKGHIVGDDSFNGTVTVTIRDVEQQIICKMNNTQETSTPFVFNDRPNTLYNGTDSVENGQFTLSFSVPRDIAYSDNSGLITAYALSSDKSIEAHGENDNFTLGDSGTASDDTTGPSIYCYLNDPGFTNGDNVNTTPYFYAELEDRNGINASGSGIGHDLELIIDGEMLRTYNLNEYFQYDFGNYQRGTVGYSIPELSEGQHRLLFRAWDVLNNSSTAELTFKVVKGLSPDVANISVLKNTNGHTTFLVTHNRIGSELDIELDIYDGSGRLLYKRTETGIATSNYYTIDWDQTIDSGSRLQTGVYIFRVLISCDGSTQASAAKKLVIVKN